MSRPSGSRGIEVIIGAEIEKASDGQTDSRNLIKRVTEGQISKKARKMALRLSRHKCGSSDSSSSREVNE
jgi:hypothetical protein